MANVEKTLYGTAVMIQGRTVFLRGKSGAGKSDLAFRLLHHGGVLVGDDQLLYFPEKEGLYVAPHPRLAGLIEVRGLGIQKTHYKEKACIDLLVDLVQHPPRLPEKKTEILQGVEIPYCQLNAFEASAVYKVLWALGKKHAIGAIGEEN